MKKNSIFLFMLFASSMFLQVNAQAVGDEIQYNGKTYVVSSENMIANPSFDDGINDWLAGNGAAITATGFTVNATGGYDGGAYIVGTQNTGKTGEHSLCMDIEIANDKTYYFCYYMKRVSDTAAGTEGYVCASQSDTFCGTENASVQGYCNADCQWTKNEMLVVNSSYKYIQFSARWISGRLGFDGFFLAEVAMPADPTDLLDLIDSSEAYFDHFGGESSAEYEPLLPLIDAAKVAAEATDASVINGAYDALSEGLLDYRIANASDADPVDVTGRYVLNANFDDGVASWDKVNETVNNGINCRFLTHFDAKGSREVEVNGIPTTYTAITQTINNLPRGSFEFKVIAATNGATEAGEDIGAYIFCNGDTLPVSTLNDSTPAYFSIEGVVLEQSITVGMFVNANAVCSYIAIDSISLIYHGLNAGFLEDYLQELRDEMTNWEGNNYDKTLPGVLFDLEDAVEWSYGESVSTLSEFTAVYDSLTAVFQQAKSSISLIVTIQSMLTDAEALLNSTEYPGHDDYAAVYYEASEFVESEDEENTHYADILAQIQALKDARLAYMDSQVATRENPADKTYLIGSPYFSDSETWSASLGNNYTIPSPWVINNSVSASDVWVGKCQPISTDDAESDPIIYRSGLNNWSNNFSSLGVYQDLTGLANGIYTVSAEFISQEDYNAIYDQHVFGTSTLGTFDSKRLDEVTTEGWNSYVWTTLSTDFIVVTDGNLRIGAASTYNPNAGYGQAGWYQVTNFQLFYYGDYTDDDLQDAWTSKLASAEELAAKLLKGDAAPFQTIIDAAKAIASEGSYIAACAKLDEGWADAETALSTYESFLAGSYKNAADKIAELVYEEPIAVLNAALTFAEDMTAANTIKATDLEAISAKLDAYIAYATYAEEVEDLVATSGSLCVAEYVNVVKQVQATQYTDLKGWFTTVETIDYLTGKLEQAVLAMLKSAAYTQSAGADVTDLIITNADIADGINGWKYLKLTATNAPYASSQHYNYSGSDTSEEAYTNPYLDAWTPTAGVIRYTTYQVLSDIPNGTYKLGVVARTDGENAFVFASTGATFVEDTIALDASTKLATIPTYGATSGELWLKDSIDLATGVILEQTEILNGNAGAGWGWSQMYIEDIVVENHTLVIGVTLDSLLTYPIFGEYKGFTGCWMSADEFTLTYVAEGNNDGWSIDTKITNTQSEPAIRINNGTITVTGVENYNVYSVDGRKVDSNAKLEKGIYVVKAGNKTQKVLVK